MYNDFPSPQLLCFIASHCLESPLMCLWPLIFFHQPLEKLLQFPLPTAPEHKHPAPPSPMPLSLAQPTQVQAAADNCSTLCQRWVLSRKARSSWWVGRQQGALCQLSPGRGGGSAPRSRRLVRVRSWLDRTKGQLPLQYLKSTVSSES